jgi:hypothetical protein
MQHIQHIQQSALTAWQNILKFSCSIREHRFNFEKKFKILLFDKEPKFIKNPLDCQGAKIKVYYFTSKHEFNIASECKLTNNILNAYKRLGESENRIEMSGLLCKFMAHATELQLGNKDIDDINILYRQISKPKKNELRDVMIVFEMYQQLKKVGHINVNAYEDGAATIIAKKFNLSEYSVVKIYCQRGKDIPSVLVADTRLKLTPKAPKSKNEHQQIVNPNSKESRNLPKLLLVGLPVQQAKKYATLNVCG